MLIVARLKYLNVTILLFEVSLRYIVFVELYLRSVDASLETTYYAGHWILTKNFTKSHQLMSL